MSDRYRDRVLVVDDDPSFRRVVDYTLSDAGYETVLAANGKEALEIFERGETAAVITDVLMPEINGLDLLKKVHARSPDVPVLVVTAHAAIDDAVAAMRAGAFDYIVKPVNREELKLVLARALEVKELLRENRHLRQVAHERLRFENMVGSSAAMEPVLETAAQAAQVDSTVLLLGESGTGKELLAKAIHFNGPRRKRPFVPVNCAAIPPTLLESELFGYRKGAFTGAVADRAGKVEAATGGTLFLDEIGDLEASLQVKILRLLQDKEIEKLGESRPERIDARIIAATNRKLEAMVRAGTFREDLYYRLSIIPIELPPLRRRREDIPLLASQFLAGFARRFGKRLALDEAALASLESYDWPGNIRELENLMERLAALRPDGTIGAKDLPGQLREGGSRAGDLVLQIPSDGVDLEKLERDLIRKALEQNEWNQTRAAKFLRLSRNTLIYRMQKYGIRKPGAGTSNA